MKIKKILMTALSVSALHGLLTVDVIANPIQTPEEIQKIKAENEARARDIKEKEAINAQAIFKASLNQVIPMKPEHIKKFKAKVDEAQAAIRSDVAPIMLNTSKKILITPGAPSQLITTHPNYVTTLLFVDSTGAAWPITSQTTGEASWYSVQKPEGIKPGNMLTISPLTNHVNTNIIVTLKDLDTPIILKIETNFKQTDTLPEKMDSLITFRLNKRGPFAKELKTSKPIKSPLNEVVLSFLNDTPPAGARPIIFTPTQDNLSAWNYNEKIYLRSFYPVKWPALWSVTSGSGDLRVYELPITSSIMLLVNGQVRTFLIN